MYFWNCHSQYNGNLRWWIVYIDGTIIVVDFYGDKEENYKSNLTDLYFQVRLIYNPIDYSEIFMTLDMNKENSTKSVYDLFIEQDTYIMTYLHQLLI